MASDRRDAQSHRSPPQTPSPTASFSTSDQSGRSTESACRVCSRPFCQLQTHRDYARRAALPFPRSGTASLQSPIEQEQNFPIEMKANMRQLYLHFFTVEIPHGEVISHPTGLSRNRALSRKYSSLAETCAPLCYSIVSFAASRIASSQGTVDDRALKHYAHAVRSLAEAVNGPATESVTLAALTLLQHDLIFFHLRAIDTHIEGIYTMIEKQGGLAYLDGAIGQVALFCDYQASLLLDRPPKYLHPSLQGARPLNAPQITNGQAFPKCELWQSVDSRLQGIIQDLCLMVEILERSCRAPSTMGDYHFFGYRRNVVENTLGSMYAEFSGSETINECLCLGMILFQSMTIGGIDTVNGVFDHLIPKFNLFVLDVYPKLGNLWATDTEMAMWLVFIGAAIPDFYRKYRGDFLQKLSRMLKASYGKDLAKSKANVRAGLSRYIWCDSMLCKRFNKTWKEITSMSTQTDTAPGGSEDDESDDDEDRQTAIGEDDSKIPDYTPAAMQSSPQEQPHFSGKGKEPEGRHSRHP